MIRINPSCRRFILSTQFALLLAVLANTQAFAQLAPLQATGSDDVGGESSALTSQVNAAFGLSASSLISLELPDTPENGIELALPIDGEVVTLLAEPESILSPSYKLYIQVESGELIEEEPAPSRTLRGFVLEYPDSIVAGSLLETGFAGTLSLSDGRQYWIEPVASKIAVVDPSIHVVYRNDNIIPSYGTCSTNGVASNLNLGGGDGLPRGSACGTGLCFAELALDADFEFYTFWGSSTTSVQNRTQLVINTMNVEYERDVDITHVVTALVIRTSDAADPYTSTDPGILVSQVRNHWNSVLPQIPRDITQLFSDKEIDGSVIGTAFNIGVVCTNQAYSYAQSDCCGSLGCATDLHAHENGHLWGGTHCDPCTSTMRSSITCSNVFTSSSISQITTHRDSRTCLATSGTYTPPFFDDFPSTTIDTTKWGIISGAQINTLGNNEPSTPNSLNIDQSDSITTVPINLTVSNNATISYHWQRTGSADSPENGEDLFVEYLNNVNVWTLLAQHPGAGSDSDPFQFASFPLPEDAKHPFFRLRFRGISTSTTGQDDFFIDNVFIDPGDITPPSPNPASFHVVPIANPSNPQAELYMEATISTDPAGPVQYFFQRTNGTPTDSGWINTNVWIGPGPVPNSPWTFRVKTRDNMPTPNETTYSVPSAAYTAIESPGGVTSGNLAGDRFDATAQGTFTALNSLQSGLFFEVKNGQGDPVGTGSNEWTSNTTSTTRTITGLLPATLYTVRVKARNRAGVETAFTSSINVTTSDLIVPGAPILGNATDVSMLLTLNTNNNLPATEYAIQCSSSSPNDSNWTNQYVNHGTGLPGPVEHWQTVGAPITINNLLPGTQYTFHVKARNPSLQETPFGGTSSLTTGVINAPLASVLSTPAVDSLQLTISSNGNSAAVQYAIQCTGTQPTDLTWQNKFVIHATGGQSATEDWQIAGVPITVTLLSPNVRYTFAVKARNASATFFTPLGADASLATLALSPGQPLVGVYPLTTTALDVTPGNMPPLFNAGDTEFAIRCSSTNPPDASWTNQYVGSTGNAGASEVWRTDSTWGNAVLLDLNLETEYVFEVKARNRDGIETTFGPSIAFTTGSDCNVNNISDLQEAAECTGSPSCGDCNENGLLDICEIGFDADQWAASVIDFSSQYDELPPSYLATQAVGAPNVTDYGDSPLAWSPADSDTGLEHVTVGFTAHVFASGAVVRENLSNGFVVRLEAVKIDDSLVEVWPLATGETDNSPTGVLADFTVGWPETSYLVKGLRVTIDTSLVIGEYEEIDAIKLLGRVPATTPDANSNGIPDSCEAVETPAAPILTAATQTGMNVAVDVDGNPGTTEYAIRCVATNPIDANWEGQYATAAGTPDSLETWQTQATWGVTTLSGMQPAVEYTFAIKARIGVGVESGFGPTTSLTTLAIVTGGCCLDTGVCDITTETGCNASGGNYLGDDTECSPNPCPQPCILVGDVNVDGVVDALDIAGYTRAKLGASPEAGENPACADFGNGDLELDNADFVTALIGA